MSNYLNTLADVLMKKYTSQIIAAGQGTFAFQPLDPPKDTVCDSCRYDGTILVKRGNKQFRVKCTCCAGKKVPAVPVSAVNGTR